MAGIISNVIAASRAEWRPVAAAFDNGTASARGNANGRGLPPADYPPGGFISRRLPGNEFRRNRADAIRGFLMRKMG
jgi:hypothetical protein